MEVGAHRAQHMPTDDDINDVFNSGSEAEQDEWLALSAQEFRSVLTDRFHEQQLRLLNPSDDILNLYRPWRQPRPWEWRRGGFGGGDNSRPGGDGGRPFGNGRGGEREDHDDDDRGNDGDRDDGGRDRDDDERDRDDDERDRGDDDDRRND
jgi:hypothetical protein